jgi:hypothetical protein
MLDVFRLSTDIRVGDNSPHEQQVRCKSLTKQAVFGVIVGFPDRGAKFSLDVCSMKKSCGRRFEKLDG